MTSVRSNVVNLRPYQENSLKALYEWLGKNRGNPCMVLPTGSGKSHIVARLCRDYLFANPQSKILMLTHTREIIRQNAEKLLTLWADAPLGIYSAGLGSKEINSITFAGIQTVVRNLDSLPNIDLIIVDESHAISHKEEGGYRKLIARLKESNPNLQVVGLTATPYRLGHGLITQGTALFDSIIEPVSIQELVDCGYLAILRSKSTRSEYDTTGLKKRGGDYLESELEARFNNQETNSAVAEEIVARAEDRRSWLLFCSGVAHANGMAQALRDFGVEAVAITGQTPKDERALILRDFKEGRIKALTNVNVLTTGFDAPNVDLMAMLRPTMSTGLYMQMAGRGMRLKEHTDHCLVLDFAGNVKTHGPITKVVPPTQKGVGGVAPTKSCSTCGEIVHASVRVCPSCGAVFATPEKDTTVFLHQDDIWGQTVNELRVVSWRWNRHVSKTSGKEMLRVRYYGGLSDPVISEYFAVTHEGYARQKAIEGLLELAGGNPINLTTIEAAVGSLQGLAPPDTIRYRKEGKFYKVVR